MGQQSDEGKSERIGNKNYKAYITSPNSLQDPDWYFGSVANNHVTYDPKKNQEFNELNGKDNLTVGNVASLNI